MAISLTRLFNDFEREYGIKLIAGKDGMNCFVRWVHIIEDAEVTGFIHGNELIFTTGITHKSNDWMLDYIKNLENHNAVGLVLNIGPYISNIPTSVIDYCNNNNFPLFTIPWDKKLIDVTFDFCHRIIENEEHESTLASAIKNLIFNPNDTKSYVSTLQRRGIYDTVSYTVFAVKAFRNGDVLPSDEWSGARFDLQTVLKNIDRPFFAFVQNEYFVILVNTVDEETTEKIQLLLSDKLKYSLYVSSVNIGVSNKNQGYDGIYNSYRQAIIACEIAVNKNIGMLLYKDTGLYKLVYCVKDKSVLREYADAFISNIAYYDEINHTDYLETLECYIKNDCSVQKVSEIQNVHRNTVNYKIKFLRKNFGLTFSNENIAELVLAFMCKDSLDK